MTGWANPTDIIEESLYAELSSLVAPFGASVYNQQAPYKATYPYVVFSMINAMDFNFSPRKEIRASYKVISVCDKPDIAREMLNTIEFTLTQNMIGQQQGWECSYLVPTAYYSVVENVEGIPLFHRVRYYEIRLYELNKV